MLICDSFLFLNTYLQVIILVLSKTYYIFLIILLKGKRLTPLKRTEEREICQRPLLILFIKLTAAAATKSINRILLSDCH